MNLRHISPRNNNLRSTNQLDWRYLSTRRISASQERSSQRFAAASLFSETKMRPFVSKFTTLFPYRITAVRMSHSRQWLSEALQVLLVYECNQTLMLTVHFGLKRQHCVALQIPSCVKPPKLCRPEAAICEMSANNAIHLNIKRNGTSARTSFCAEKICM